MFEESENREAKNSSDTNIQLLIQLMGKVEETFDSLANINGIEIEEVE